MNLQEAYRQIWSGKLESIQPPHKQSIDRVNRVFDLLCRHHLPVNRMTGYLLDVGCGSGAMLAKAQSAGFSVAGVDFDGPLLDWLRTNHFKTIFNCDLNEGVLPSPLLIVDPVSHAGNDASDGWSIITCADVIEHLIDPFHLLSEIYRVLKPGGHAYVSTPNASFWRRVQQLARGEMFRTSGDRVLKDGGHLSYWGPHDLKSALEQAGFREVGIEFTNIELAPNNARFGEWSSAAYMIAYAVK